MADASLFLAACAHAHGWQWDDWDRLAAGILVGHLLECSGQSLGGNYSGDWWALPHPWDLPYPIATVEPDGTAVVSKPRSPWACRARWSPSSRPSAWPFS